MENTEIFKLKKELERLKNAVKKQRYGLVWMDIPEAFEDDVQNKLSILKEIPELAIKSENGKPSHILIEGDNYHALTCLNYTHKGKINMIYIDPPYNTGSDGFRYKDKRMIDKFPDGTEVPIDHPFRHSYWLSFMKKRLEIAKELLSDRGVIFVSIDDNELSQLKLLFDEIFDKNFIGMFIHKNNSSKNQANLLSISTEYLLLYQRRKDGLKGIEWKITKKGAKDIAQMFKKLKEKGLSIEEIEEQIKEMYIRPKYMHLSRWNKVDKKGVFVDADLSREGGPKDYTIINPHTKKRCVIPERGWGKPYEELLRLQKENLIWYGDENTPPRMKVYITDENYMVPDSLLYFDNSIDTRMIKDMFGKLVFENPKPLELIKTIIKMSTSKDAIILDFFAGSGTTGHAVLELNEEDESQRQFILCTNNENNICSEVCYPRISKVIKGWKSKTNHTNFKGTEGTLKYYKTVFIGKNNILKVRDEDRIELAHNAGELLAIAENTLELIKQNKYYQLFENNSADKYTAVYFREELDKFQEFVDIVEKLKKKTTVYVFSWGEEGFADDFSHLQGVQVKTIPQPILEIYKNIYNLD